jgi:hypothetical protein
VSNLLISLEALLRTHAAACGGPLDDAISAEQFRKRMKLLIADCG